MSTEYFKWLLVRACNKHIRFKDGEVIGIVELKNFGMPDDQHNLWAHKQVKLMNDYVGSQDWDWSFISQAVFETYRDLHGFKVIKISQLDL